MKAIKKRKQVNNDEEDFGLCENRELFDKLLIRLKKKRDEILQRENGNNDNDDNDEGFHLDVFKNNKKEIALDEIFTVNGLKELCRKLPTEEKELTDDNIYGVNKKSLKNYGKEFLPLVKEFIQENNIKKEEELEKKYPKKKNKEKKSEKKSGKKRKKSYKKNENKNIEQSEEKKEVEDNIIIPDSGVYNLNQDDFVDELDLYMIEGNNNIENKDEEKEESIGEKEINTQKEKNEDIFNEKYLNQAKELSKINNKKKINSESDESQDSNDEKKKDRFGKYNYFQRKRIFEKINKGKHKKK